MMGVGVCSCAGGEAVAAQRDLFGVVVVLAVVGVVVVSGVAGYSWLARDVGAVVGVSRSLGMFAGAAHSSEVGVSTSLGMYVGAAHSSSVDVSSWVVGVALVVLGGVVGG